MSHAAPRNDHGHDTGLTHCPNCGRRLEGAFCASCGQKAVALNPTLHHFLHDFTHELLHVDGKIFRSVRLLLLRPGFLSREWFEGRRARSISPIRLYLVFSVAFFAVSAIGAMDLNINAADRQEIGREITTDPRQVADRVGQWFPRAMFVLVPVFALFVSAVTRSAGRNYPQDLYFALHTHAAIFAALALGQLLGNATSGLLEDLVDVLIFAYAAWYFVAALRTAYGGTVRLAIGRAAIVGPLYGFAIIMTVVAVALMAMFA